MFSCFVSTQKINTFFSVRCVHKQEQKNSTTGLCCIHHQPTADKLCVCRRRPLSALDHSPQRRPVQDILPRHHPHPRTKQQAINKTTTTPTTSNRYTMFSSTTLCFLYVFSSFFSIVLVTTLVIF